MSMKILIQAHQRLVILRCLSEVPGYDLNESILQDSLDLYGLDISRDALRTQLAWLEEQDCISLKDLSGTQIATLSNRGIDAVNGRATIPGIKRPRPGE